LVERVDGTFPVGLFLFMVRVYNGLLLFLAIAVSNLAGR
jgi:hypothetical protein